MGSAVPAAGSREPARRWYRTHTRTWGVLQYQRQAAGNLPAAGTALTHAHGECGTSSRQQGTCPPLVPHSHTHMGSAAVPAAGSREPACRWYRTHTRTWGVLQYQQQAAGNLPAAGTALTHAHGECCSTSGRQQGTCLPLVPHSHTHMGSAAVPAAGSREPACRWYRTHTRTWGVLYQRQAAGNLPAAGGTERPTFPSGRVEQNGGQRGGGGGGCWMEHVEDDHNGANDGVDSKPVRRTMEKVKQRPDYMEGRGGGCSGPQGETH
ncbi:hypothetical protein NHX12_010502 [Muraenolepis orangiensis]|uniref:Uncharacterized protein n=1 Tax=Muraenolepis orangiensis TaxID=630683 RepID=A0A9Q0I8I2_9TELE|nr:hypothetical protein NHX12_010502 [Muraenolepis orangiensis]